ncbi:MAG: hypothetical protein O3A00_00785 [Planctomycetota bacterium]|nr:hypothetical protein [Planctomycetota bacterium]
MSERPFIPASLSALDPRVEVWEGNRPVRPSLAGYPLKPGHEYRIRVVLPGFDSDRWLLKCSGSARLIDRVEQGDSDERAHEVRVLIPRGPFNFLSSLRKSAADITLSVSFAEGNRPPIELRVAFMFSPSVWVLLGVLAAFLVPLSGSLHSLSRHVTEFVEREYGYMWTPIWVTILIGSAVWMTVAMLYVYWKKRRQPAARARELWQRFEKTLNGMTTPAGGSGID